MPYLFTPPCRRQYRILAGRSFRYSYKVSSTVYKVNGVWTAVESPAADTLSAATRVLSVPGTPVIIDDATANELLTQGLSTLYPNADYPATCEPIWAARE